MTILGREFLRDTTPTSYSFGRVAFCYGSRLATDDTITNGEFATDHLTTHTIFADAKLRRGNSRALAIPHSCGLLF